MEIEATEALPSIDWEAISTMLLKENEQLRMRIVRMREEMRFDLSSLWQDALDLLDEPRYQVLLLLAVPIILTIIRELFKLLWRKRHHEG